MRIAYPPEPTVWQRLCAEAWSSLGSSVLALVLALSLVSRTDGSDRFWYAAIAVVAGVCAVLAALRWWGYCEDDAKSGG